MGYLGVGLLLVLWAWLLVPGAVRSARGTSPLHSAMTFERAMVHLASTRAGTGRHVLVLRDPAAITRSSARARLLRRRRLLCARFAAAVPLTGMFALVIGGLAWLLFSLATVLFVGYVVALFRVRARQAAKRRTVRRMPVGSSQGDAAPPTTSVTLRAG